MQVIGQFVKSELQGDELVGGGGGNDDAAMLAGDFRWPCKSATFTRHARKMDRTVKN
jgi:hypothetical protein